MSEISADLKGRRHGRPARAHKAAMVVAQGIVDEMGRSDFKPGTKLPMERDMLLEYGVGRGTLRESLRFLEMNGVITMKPGPGGGPVIGDADSYDLAGILGLFLQVNKTPFSAIVEVRRELEPIIAGLAATHATDDDVKAISQSVAMMAENLENEQIFLRANEQFHEYVADAAGNPIFALLICSLHWITDGVRVGISYPIERRAAVLRAHESIAAAIEQRDVAIAQATMARHLKEFDKYVTTVYPTAYDRLLRWSDINP